MSESTFNFRDENELIDITKEVISAIPAASERTFLYDIEKEKLFTFITGSEIGNARADPFINKVNFNKKEIRYIEKNKYFLSLRGLNLKSWRQIEIVCFKHKLLHLGISNFTFEKILSNEFHTEGAAKKFTDMIISTGTPYDMILSFSNDTDNAMFLFHFSKQIVK